MTKSALRLVALPLSLILALTLGACQGGSGDDDQEAAAPTAAVSGDGVVLEPRDSIDATVKASPDAADEPTTDDPTADPEPSHASSSDLVVGNCYNETETSAADSSTIGDIDIVDCALPHVYEVFAQGEITTPSFPTDEEVQSEATRICDPEFVNYVGVDYGASQYSTIKIISPREAGWILGDHMLTCTLSLADESPTSGSARGSGQ